MTFEERLEKVERKNEDLEKEVRTLREQKGRLRKLSLASIALALAALIGGTALSVRAWTAAIEPKTISTQAITLKDTSGRARVTLNGADGRVLVYDKDGKVRAALSPFGVAALDANGVNRVLLSAPDNKIYFKNSGNQIVKTIP